MVTNAVMSVMYNSFIIALASNAKLTLSTSSAHQQTTTDTDTGVTANTKDSKIIGLIILNYKDYRVGSSEMTSYELQWLVL